MPVLGSQQYVNNLVSGAHILCTYINLSSPWLFTSTFKHLSDTLGNQQGSLFFVISAEISL